MRSQRQRMPVYTDGHAPRRLHIFQGSRPHVIRSFQHEVIILSLKFFVSGIVQSEIDKKQTQRLREKPVNKHSLCL
jgi:hypothetical protein